MILGTSVCMVDSVILGTSDSGFVRVHDGFGKSGYQ